MITIQRDKDWFFEFRNFNTFMCSCKFEFSSFNGHIQRSNPWIMRNVDRRLCYRCIHNYIRIHDSKHTVDLLTWRSYDLSVWLLSMYWPYYVKVYPLYISLNCWIQSCTEFYWYIGSGKKNKLWSAVKSLWELTCSSTRLSELTWPIYYFLFRFTYIYITYGGYAYTTMYVFCTIRIIQTYIHVFLCHLCIMYE